MDYFNVFVSARGISKSRERIYRAAIRYYEEYTGLDIGGLIREAEEDEDAGLRMSRRRILIRLTGFRDHLKGSGLKATTVNQYMSAVKTFYRFFDIEVPSVKSLNADSKGLHMLSIPDRRLIRRIVENSPVKYKAMILLQVSSGMGSAEVCNMDYKDFVDAIGFKPGEVGWDESIERITRDNIVGEWRVRRKKTGYSYVTFSTPEANNMIVSYLMERGEPDLKDPLFLTDRGHRMNSTTYGIFLNHLRERLGLGAGEDGLNLIRSHNFRKFFASRLYGAGMDKMMVDWLLGHKVDAIDGAYFKWSVEDVKKEYMRFMGRLYVRDKIIMIRGGDRRVRELELELREKEERLRELEDEIDYVRSLVRNIEPLLRDKGFLDYVFCRR